MVLESNNLLPEAGWVRRSPINQGKLWQACRILDADHIALSCMDGRHAVAAEGNKRKCTEYAMFPTLVDI